MNSSSMPLSCRALKTLLLFLVLKIAPAFTKLQTLRPPLVSLLLQECHQVEKKTFPKGFWHCLPVSCQSRHPPFHAGQPWPWRCAEWQHRKVPSRSWQHDQQCTPAPDLLSGPCPASSWRIAWTKVSHHSQGGLGPETNAPGHQEQPCPHPMQFQLWLLPAPPEPWLQADREPPGTALLRWQQRNAWC